ncbi:hypothetical protein [Streptomyces ipomoeae]|uniref:hypothetical protein n=1 Tax=Streptomyces ipomoeae TaxID=103232 RepID=UPI001146FFBE|nr:hypothetical protein [Streptomyces ipomoeae]TQE33134.1 hypothetical protein Sipo7851_21810 [Streptomyces ipomoeae]
MSERHQAAAAQPRPEVLDIIQRTELHALRATLTAVLQQVDPAWLEREFGTHHDAAYLSDLLLVGIWRTALREGELNIRLVGALAEECSGWPGSTEMFVAGADVLRDMARTGPPVPDEQQDPPAPGGSLELTWTGQVTHHHADGSAVIVCRTPLGHPAELRLDAEHREALGGPLVDPPAPDDENDTDEEAAAS